MLVPIFLDGNNLGDTCAELTFGILRAGIPFSLRDLKLIDGLDLS